MTSNDPIAVFNSQTQEYERAFDAFLRHTDQKTNARAWLNAFLAGLPVKNTAIDVGAGNGELTLLLQGLFQKTIAIEPNPALRGPLEAMAGVDVIPSTILGANPQASANLAVCSHVLYYIPESNWITNISRILSWLAPAGTALFILQNADTDCMGMVDHFLSRRFQFAAFARDFEKSNQEGWKVEIETVPAHIRAPDFETAFPIAEFMLNLVPSDNPPSRASVGDYLRERFQQPDGGYVLSCHQDMVLIRRPSAGS